MKTMAGKISDVEVGCRTEDTRVALSCVLEGARYHVWMDCLTNKIEETVYKNPVDDGKKKTVKLKASSGPMKALIAAMLEVYHRDGLLKKLEMKEAIAEAKRLEQAHQEWARQVKQEAAEELYNLLKVLLDAIAHGHNTDQDVQMAREVLARIDKKIKE